MRDADRDDRRRPQLAQEEEEHHDGEKATEDRGVAHLVDAALDEQRAVRHQLQNRASSSIELLGSPLDPPSPPPRDSRHRPAAATYRPRFRLTAVLALFVRLEVQLARQRAFTRLARATMLASASL